MKERPRKNEPPQFLSGWKEIANYLGKGVRTVQRYEALFGLPVRRPAGKPWGSVLATKAELDGWVKATPLQEVFPLRDSQIEYDSQAIAIRTGVSEMIMLRKQMLELRAEVKKSVEALRDSIYGVQTGLAQNVWSVSSLPRNDTSLCTADENELIGKSEAQLIAAPTKYPKAS